MNVDGYILIQNQIKRTPKLSQSNITTNMSKLDPYAHLKLVLNPDGTVTRLIKFPTIDAKPEPDPGDTVVTKDVIINPQTNLWVRIFRPTKLPSNDNTIARLPIIMYLHGGGFVFFDVSSTEPHDICSQIATEMPVIIVSVNYRLAPEHKLPAPYEDAVDAILWVKNQLLDPEGDQWLKDYGDFTRFYILGHGNGGNIGFHAALTAMDLDIKPLKICGLVLNQPMFGGVQRAKSELQFADDPLLPLPVLDLMWDLALPDGVDRDHPYCNPIEDGPHKSKINLLRRCLVIGFGQDPIVDRLQDFVKMLASFGVQVDAQFDDVGFRNVDAVDVGRATAVLNYIKQFVI